MTPTWLFPPKPSREGAQPIGAVAQHSILPFYGQNLASPKKKKKIKKIIRVEHGPYGDAMGALWGRLSHAMLCWHTEGPGKGKKLTRQEVTSPMASKPLGSRMECHKALRYSV